MMDPKAKDLSFMHINIRGLRQNFEELIFTLNEKNIDIASINETFLRRKHKLTNPGYQLIKKDDSTGQGWGERSYLLKMIYHKCKYLNWIICSYYSSRGIVYKQLFEKLGNKSNDLLIKGTSMLNLI